VDRIDRAIVDQLRRDSSLTNAELADRVGLTPSPCLRRVRQLERRGVILGYRARIDPAALGRAFEVVVHINLAAQNRQTFEQFEAGLTALAEVVEARRMFGSPDYVVVVAVADLATYERFLTTKLADVPGLGQLTSHFPMKTIKSDVISPAGARRR
jgi:DNA-binding Lrp family transcriptional regulator